MTELAKHAAPAPSVILNQKDRWAKVQRPGRDIPDSPEARKNYFAAVLAIQDGEPPLTEPASCAPGLSVARASGR